MYINTTEAEYVALSEFLQETIPVMDFIDELKLRNIGTYHSKTNVRCKAFADNTRALELAMVSKIRARTCHINIKYDHFRSPVRTGRITVQAVDTKEQIADIFTKPLNKKTFRYLQEKLMVWRENLSVCIFQFNHKSCT